MEVEEQFGDQVTFIGVPGLSNSLDAKADFLNSTGANTFPTVTEGDALWERFGANVQGTFAFVNDDGTFETIVHPVSLTEQVEKLISS